MTEPLVKVQQGQTLRDNPHNLGEQWTWLLGKNLQRRHRTLDYGQLICLWTNHLAYWPLLTYLLNEYFG